VGDLAFGITTSFLCNHASNLLEGRQPQENVFWRVMHVESGRQGPGQSPIPKQQPV
jgi:hypothetical protein